MNYRFSDLCPAMRAWTMEGLRAEQAKAAAATTKADKAYSENIPEAIRTLPGLSGLPPADTRAPEGS